MVDVLMGELTDLPYDDETWGAKFTVMKENVEHHVEEEEGDMFVKARQVFDKAELEDLGTRMEARKVAAGAGDEHPDLRPAEGHIVSKASSAVAARSPLRPRRGRPSIDSTGERLRPAPAEPPTSRCRAERA